MELHGLFLGHFFILIASQAVIVCIGVLLSGSTVLCHMLDVHLFLLPQCVPDTERTR